MSRSVNKTINRGSIIALGSNFFAKGAQVVSRGIITRLTGAYGLGLFELVLSLTRWLSVMGQGGAHQTIVQFVAGRRSKNLWSEIFNILWQSLLYVIVVTSALCGLLVLFSDNVYQLLFEGISSYIVLMEVIALTFLMALSNFLGSYLRGLNQLFADRFLTTIAFPIIVFGCSVFFYYSNQEMEITQLLNYVCIIYGIVVIVAVILVVVRGYLRTDTFASTSYAGEIWNYSYPIWLNSILNASRAQFSRLLIPILATTTELGYFSAAYTLAFMTSFVGNSFTPVNQTLVAEAYEHGDIDKIKRVYNNILNKSSGFVVLIMGGVVLFGDVILGVVFGTDFLNVYWLLVVLTLGESINTLSGPSGNILLMTENQGLSTRIMSYGFLLLMVLSVGLIPLYGAMGAALAASASLSYVNIARVMAIKKIFGISPSYGLLFRSNYNFVTLTLAFGMIVFFVQKGTQINIILLLGYFLAGGVLMLRKFSKMND